MIDIRKPGEEHYEYEALFFDFFDDVFSSAMGLVRSAMSQVRAFFGAEATRAMSRAEFHDAVLDVLNGFQLYKCSVCERYVNARDAALCDAHDGVHGECDGALTHRADGAS